MHLVVAALLAAQGVNLDLGTEHGAPPDDVGAAAGQIGAWNEWGGNDTAPFPLVGLDGGPTSMTFVQSIPFGSAFVPVVAAQGDAAREDERLLFDYFDLHTTPHTFELHGVAAGRYALYTYALGPDDPAFRTTVALAGDDGVVDAATAVLVGGAWTGAYEEGVTHARHELTVHDGDVVRVFTFGVVLRGTLSALQLVPLDDDGPDAGAPDDGSTPEDAGASLDAGAAGDGGANAGAADAGDRSDVDDGDEEGEIDDPVVPAGCAAAGHAACAWALAALCVGVGRRRGRRSRV